MVAFAHGHAMHTKCQTPLERHLHIHMYAIESCVNFQLGSKVCRCCESSAIIIRVRVCVRIRIRIVFVFISFFFMLQSSYTIRGVLFLFSARSDAKRRDATSKAAKQPKQPTQKFSFSVSLSVNGFLRVWLKPNKNK